MGKKAVIIIVVIVIVAAIVLGLARNNKKSPSANNQSNQTAQTGQTAQKSQSQTSQPVANNAVTIQNFAFMPGDITVKKGTTVTWTNQDSTAHTVSETDSQKGPDSGNLNPGDKYSFTFDQTGTYKYRCNIHPNMLGTVTVTE